MAISGNAMTLADYAVASNDALVMAVTFSLRDSGSVLTDIPFVTNSSLIVNGVRWEGNLPTVNWAKINAEGVTTKGDPKPYQESAFLIRNYIDVDKRLVQDKNQIQDPRGMQLAAYLKAVTYDFNDKFINNDHATGNSDAIVGIRARLDAPGTYGVATANKIDAGGAVMTQGMTQAQANAFIEWLDQLLYAVDSQDGEGVVLYTNEVLKRRIATACRTLGTSGGFSIVKDQFDRTVEMYRGAQLRDIGLKADQSTRIITTTETAAGLNGASTMTSLYAVRYGEEYCYGWQFETLQARDLGLMENGVIYRTMVDWAGGLVFPNIRAIARLYDIKIS